MNTTSKVQYTYFGDLIGDHPSASLDVMNAANAIGQNVLAGFDIESRWVTARDGRKVTVAAVRGTTTIHAVYEYEVSAPGAVCTCPQVRARNQSPLGSDMHTADCAISKADN